jgi:hypothetical protein
MACNNQQGVNDSKDAMAQKSALALAALEKRNISGAWRQRRQHLQSVMAGARKSVLRSAHGAINGWRRKSGVKA